MSHIALAWLLQRPKVASVLVGARTTEQLADNLKAADLTLDDESMMQLSMVSASGVPPYPHGVLEEYCGMDIWKKLNT